MDPSAETGRWIGTLRILRRSFNMFKSGTKRGSEERTKAKKVKQPPAPEASATASKGKAWRRMKEVKVKKSCKSCPDSPNSSNSEGGFSQLEPIRPISPMGPPDASAASAPTETAGDANPSIKIQIDVEVEGPEGGQPPPREAEVAVQTEEVEPEAIHRQTEPELPTVPPPPVERRISSSKSEPAANVYLKQRRVVSRSKFLLDQRKNSGIPAEKLSRYQKLARDTKNLVARLSGGEIPSPEKMRQALKIPSGASATQRATRPESLEITHPDFCCDEETAAILLAELEGTCRAPGVDFCSAAAATAAPSGADGTRTPDHYSVPEASLEPFLKTQRFAQLRSLYRSLERLNDLERTVSGSRMAGSSRKVIDFDLWRRLRRQERAQAEMNHLSTWLRAAQRDGDCFFGQTPSGGGSIFDWQSDIGLRSRHQSVRKLTQKFRSMERFGSQSLPRNFNSTVHHGGYSSARGASALPPARQRRSSSLSSRQMQALKEQLSKVYTGDPPLPASGASRKEANTAHSKLFVRSASDSARRIDSIRQPSTPSTTTKALSISGADASAPHKASSTRAAIEYVQQLSRQMSKKMSDPSASGASGAASPSGRESKASVTHPGGRNDSRMSASSDDYLLVLTPRADDKRDDVEDVVKEWAQAEGEAQPPELPKRSSSFIRNEEDTVSSTNSSVQTVIHRDVQDKVDYFEHVIATSGHPHAIRTSQSFSDLHRASAEHLDAKPRSRSVCNRADETLMDMRLNHLADGARKSSSGSISGRKNPVSSGGWTDYINSVKKGDVVNKCQYFTGSLPSTPVPRVPWRSAGIRNSTVVKGYEKGNVDYTRQRYEQIRKSRSMERTPLPASGSKRISSGVSPRSTGSLLDIKSVPSFTWARGFFSNKKQVSFPNTPAGMRKKPDFTKVKPTRLSAARLALRQSKNIQQTPSAPSLGFLGRKESTSKPELSQFRNSGSFSDVASSCNSSVANYRSFSQGSVCSRSPLPSRPPVRTLSADGQRLRSPSPLTRTPLSTSAPPPASTGSSGRKESTAFDPSMHKPTFRYTPPPPRVRKNVADMYATYPRRRLHDRPPRPPLPATFIRKAAAATLPSG